MARQKLEDDNTKYAYALYLCAGRNRNIIDVAKKVGYAPRTIQMWRSSLNWDDRVQHFLKTHGNRYPHECGMTLFDIMRGLRMSKSFKWPNITDVHFPKEDEIIPYNEVISDAIVPTGPAKFSIDDYNTVEVEEGPAANLKANVEKISTNFGVMTKTEYRSLLGTMVREFAQSFQNGDIKIKSIYEFEKVVKLDLLLMNIASPGEPPDGVLLGGMGGGNTNVQINQFNINQDLKSNPKIQNLMSELWREYNGSGSEGPIFDHSDTGSEAGESVGQDIRQNDDSEHSGDDDSESDSGLTSGPTEGI